MMKILPAVIFFVTNYVFVRGTKTTSGSNLIQTYANVSAALGKYFSSACIYLVTHSDEQDMLLLTMTSKYISSVYVMPNVVTSFTDYYKMINSTAPLDRCYVPMQVILDPDDDPLFKKDFSIFSQKTSMHGTDQYGGGVWLLFLKSFENDFVDEYFRSIYLPFDVELIVAWIDKTKNMVHLKEAYRVVPSYPIRQPYLGNWTTEIGLRAPRDPLHYSRRTDLEGLKMNVGYVDYPPITIIEKGPTEKQLTGYFGDIWKVLEDAMNATSVLEESEEFGEYLIESDKWTGLLGEIKYNRVDVAVADFILTRNRFEHMDYSFPLIVTTYQIFYQFAGSKSDANALFLPLSYDIWVTLGAWLLIGTVVLYAGCYLTDKYLGTHEHFELNTSFFCILGALSAQGANDIPKITSSRILFFLTHMIGSVLVPAYSASLISYLTVTPTLIPFTTMGEFYLNGQYKMMVRQGSYEGDIFAYGSADDKYVRMIYDRDIKDHKDLPKRYHDALPMMCSDKYKAFFGVDDTMQWILDKAEHQDKSLKNCMVTKMQKDVGKVTIGMVFPKKSHFKGLVNHHIRNFQSIGIMERLRKKYWTEYDKMLGEVWSPVNVASIIMMYVILGAGVALGLVLLFFEKIVGAYRKQHPLPKKPEMFKIQNGHHGHHGHQNGHHNAHQNVHQNGHHGHENGHQNGYQRVTSPKFATSGHFHHNLGEHIRDFY